MNKQQLTPAQQRTILEWVAQAAAARKQAAATRILPSVVMYAHSAYPMRRKGDLLVGVAQ